MPIIDPNRRHLKMDKELKLIIERYQDLPPIEILAIMSQAVGYLMTRQIGFTADEVTDTITKNIELGNRAAIGEILVDKARGRD